MALRFTACRVSRAAFRGGNAGNSYLRSNKGTIDSVFDYLDSNKLKPSSFITLLPVVKSFGWSATRTLFKL
jgi:hypothetical protein